MNLKTLLDRQSSYSRQHIFRLVFLSTVLTAPAGCRSALDLGLEDVPPLPKSEPGVYTDINPRWSHDGKRICFLRSTPDRRLQLYLSDSHLERATALLEAELVSPDRPYSSHLRRYSSPSTVAWSPDDRQIAFERAEWFQFEDGQRLPGTGIWSFEVHTGRVTPLILHPKRYTNLYYYYHTPSWSPDGAYLSFVAEGINGQHTLGIRCLTSEKPKEVVPRFDNYATSDWPSWRGEFSVAAKPGVHSEHRPALIYCQGIFRNSGVPTTATLRCIQPGHAESGMCGERWRMTPAECAVLPSVKARQTAGAVIEPRIGQTTWSPDGKQIAFTLTPDALDYSRYELWVYSTETNKARRVSPADGKGYLDPVWIDSRRLGALSPNGDRYNVVSVSVSRGRRRVLGAIDTADCDWSPDRRRIVYSVPSSETPQAADGPTSLRILDTKLKVRVPWRPEALED